MTTLCHRKCFTMTDKAVTPFEEAIHPTGETPTVFGPTDNSGRAQCATRMLCHATRDIAITPMECTCRRFAASWIESQNCPNNERDPEYPLLCQILRSSTSGCVPFPSIQTSLSAVCLSVTNVGHVGVLYVRRLNSSYYLANTDFLFIKIVAV